MTTYVFRTDGGWRPQIQDIDDPYYNKPRELLEGCSCKKDCVVSKKCSCMSNANRGKKCSRLTCKSCPCFKRVKDSVNEDLQLSTRYQNFMDDLSDDSLDNSDDLQLSNQYQNLTTINDLFYDSYDSSECSDGNVSSNTELDFSDFDDNFHIF